MARPRMIAVGIASLAVLVLVLARPFGPVGLFLLLTAVVSVAVAAVGWPGNDAPATGAGGGKPRSAPAGAAAPSAEDKWVRAAARHDEVLGAYGAYELDPAMLLRYPALWDLAAPPVMAFHDALEHANALRTERYPDAGSAGRYIAAVTELRSAWVAADRYARGTGTTGLAEVDARDCERGLKLLRHAEATDSAESAAYLEQVLATMDRLAERGVIAAPRRARRELERRARRAIEP